MPGVVAKHHNPVIVAMAKQLQARGMVPNAIIGANMRRLVHLIYGVIKSERSFDMAIQMRGLAFQDGISPLSPVASHPDE
jgi:transposase